MNSLLSSLYLLNSVIILDVYINLHFILNKPIIKSWSSYIRITRENVNLVI